MSGVLVFMIIAPIILFLCFLLWILLGIKKAEKIESLIRRIEGASIIPEPCEWDPRPRTRSLDIERASGIPDITSNSHQETPTDAASSSRIPGQQPSQQSLRVNFPPEIILAPSQHIINQKCDRPPSYESLFPT